MQADQKAQGFVVAALILAIVFILIMVLNRVS